MKRFYSLLLITMLVISAKATVCVDYIYQGEYINMYLCQNHSRYTTTRSLLFEGKAKYLNNYIKEKIKKGELLNKKLELAIYDQILTYPRLEISQGENGYFIDISGFPSIEELIVIVDYFTQKDWQPFFTRDFQNVDVSKQMQSFFEKQNTNSLRIPKYQPITVWESGKVSLAYHTEDDRLYYYLNGKLIRYIQANLSLPVQTKDRTIFFEEGQISVYQDSLIVKQFSTEDCYEDYNIHIFKDWVNIYWNGSKRWIYSYSYKKNKFYTNNINK